MTEAGLYERAVDGQSPTMAPPWPIGCATATLGTKDLSKAKLSAQVPVTLSM